jgi:hypothetical protein
MTNAKQKRIQPVTTNSQAGKSFPLIEKLFLPYTKRQV